MTLSRMLQLIILSTCSAALLLAALCLFTYEWTMMKQNMIADLTAHAEILGTNSRAALLFGDKKSAQTTLEAIAAKPHIVKATLLDSEGKIFAIYHYGDSSGKQVFKVAREIVLDNEVVGRIILVSDLDEIYSRLYQYALILLFILILAMVAAGIIAGHLQNFVSEPIIALAQAAQRVSKDNDYSIRVPIPKQKELKNLTLAFNHMLGEIKSYSTKLEESNRNLQDFTHICSHDLQEPLRKVRAFGDRLKDKFSETLGEEGLDYLGRMQNAASRMQDLIRSLLEFSRVSSKTQPFVPVNLDTIAREVLSDLETRIESTQGQVDLINLPTIDADPLQMRQLIQNLVGNALKFNRDNIPPYIQVEGRFLTNGQTGQCEITVRDNGIGFDQKYADKIFGIFQRLNTRNDYEGTGVGLAIVKKIIERHQGSIKAQSGVGEGATFIIILPIHQPNP